MPAPTSYTEATLAEWMKVVIGEIAVDLDWQDTASDGDYVEPIQQVEIQLGVADVADWTGSIELLLRHARVELWKRVVEAYVGEYDVGGFAQTLQRDQLFQHARVMYAQALDDLAQSELELRNEESGYPTTIATSGAVRVKAVWW